MSGQDDGYYDDGCHDNGCSDDAYYDSDPPSRGGYSQGAYSDYAHYPETPQYSQNAQDGQYSKSGVIRSSQDSQISGSSRDLSTPQYSEEHYHQKGLQADEDLRHPQNSSGSHQGFGSSWDLQGGQSSRQSQPSQSTRPSQDLRPSQQRSDRYGPWTTRSHGINKGGNRWDSRDYGPDAPNQNPYHYSNNDGSYAYNNPDGSKYYNTNDGYSRYEDPNGKIYEKFDDGDTRDSNPERKYE